MVSSSNVACAFAGVTVIGFLYRFLALANCAATGSTGYGTDDWSEVVLRCLAPETILIETILKDLSVGSEQ